MLRSKLRFVFAGFLTCSFAFLVSWGENQVAGQAAFQPVGKAKQKNDDKVKEKREGLPGDENIPFAPPYERDAKSQLEAARKYLEWNQIPWNTICPLLQNILEAKSDSFFNVTYKAGKNTEVNRISVKTEANRIIAAFPKAGLEFYQQAYGQTASAQLEDAIKANYDIPALAALSQRYFHTKAGGEATGLLGTLYLERGNYLEAADAFERLLSRSDAEEFTTPLTLFKACIAFKRCGDPKYGELLNANLISLRKATDRDGLVEGRKKYNFDQLQAEIDRSLQLILPTTTIKGDWAMVKGNASRAGTVAGGPPFLDPIFRTSMFYAGDEEGTSWIKNLLDQQFRDEKKRAAGVPLPGFFPVTTADMVVFRSYNGIYGVASRDQVVNGRVIRAGDVRWISKTPLGLNQLMTSIDNGIPKPERRAAALNWWSTYAQGSASSVLYENPLLGTLAHDGTNVYFIDDLAIPPPPALNNGNFFGGFNPGGMQQPQSGDLANGIRAGRLAAVDLKSGNLKWELGRVDEILPVLNDEEADKTTSAFDLCLDAIFLGAPLPMNGKLYVLIEKSSVIRLLCLDPKVLVPVPGRPNRVPALVWSQKLGQPNSSLSQDSIRRYQGATLAAGEGIIVCPTNSGAVIAVDAMSHSLLWAHAYRFLDQEPNNNAGGRMRPGMINPNTGMPYTTLPLENNRWHSAGPIVANGRVIVTAYDSKNLECLDLRTGKRLWWVPRESGDLYVGGIVNDRVIVVGKNQVRGYHLMGEDTETQKPRMAFDPVTLQNVTPTGHGVGGKSVFYIPVRPDNAGKDAAAAAEIWSISVETGKVLSKTSARKRNESGDLIKYGLGNLVFQDGMVFAQSPWELAAFPQLEQKKAEMNNLLAANPKDPIGLLARGELLLDDGKLKEAIADFKEAQKHNLPIEKQPLLREKLYVAYTEMIRNDFAEGEKYLAEYETLCEVPVDGDLDALEKQHRIDETLRRQRMYLYYLAKGRETQGRLGEAFDKYLALASLGEGQNLLEMPDEPNVRMRPDVWARGRIEAMIRKATDPEARKSLEQRVGKEWDAVKDGRDLKRLREFVTVFGPYFVSGADAQFLLADKLIETHNEADSREAQTHLAQLRANAESPTLRARATEALARLMVKNQMMEDAVGLYLQLGKEYPDVVIRDGKTGADFMTSLLTDKRLLPYLEPSRFPLPSRVKAEQVSSQNQFNNGVFEIEPSGDLYPIYKRNRFVIDQYSSGNNTWKMVASDRSTGQVRATFTGITPLQMSNPGNFPFSKYIQANGQLIVAQLGATVYCFDLAEKRERWNFNLLGDLLPGNNMNRVQQNNANEDWSIRDSDGHVSVIGQSVVLQPSYCALLSRDGLEVVEPMTKNQLWTRRGIADRTQIYGDSRCIVLIEMAQDHKPASIKILRAVDGNAVEGAPDSAATLAAAKAYTILGRTALLSEGGGDQARVLRLYDLTTGKDVWKREYDAKSVPIKALSTDWSGFVKPNGEAEIVDVRTGKVLVTLRIDEKNLEADLKPCGEAQLLADNERFYLILDRDKNAPSSNGTTAGQLHNSYLRTLKVNGPFYAFERTSGKRLWNYGNGLFEHQYLILERFAELPVIVASAPMIMPGNRQQVTPIVVVEKARGRLLLESKSNYMGWIFQTVNVNHKTGTVDFIRQDLRVTISPDENTKLVPSQ